MKQVSWILALVVGAAIGFAAKGALVGTTAPAAVRNAAAAAPNRPARPVDDPKAVYRVPVASCAAQGPADALVTFVESSDFECPFCRRAAPTVKQLQAAYQGKVRFVFKHNPLGMHPNAMPAAIAAEEARAQKGDAGFWAMHDALFDPAATLDQAGLERAAAAVGLDVARLKASLASKAYADHVGNDQRDVTSIGAGATPTFFVNGRKVVGGLPFEAFKALIDEELQKAQALVAGGVAPGQVYETIQAKAATAPVYLAGTAPAQPAGQGAAPPPPAPPRTAYAKIPLRADDPARGPADAPVTIVLFSDFQCPFCSRVEPTLKTLQDAYPGKLRVVWKHQPLPGHQHARPAALLAEAAREQGKFWPIHDAFFSAQQDLGPDGLERAAKLAGLDLAKAKSAQAKGGGEARIAEDQQLAGQVGVTGTPTMFINCRKLVGALPVDSFKPVVEEELKKAEALLAGGAKKGAGFYEKACEANLTLVPAVPKLSVRPDDPVKGAAAAPVTLVLFSDFQCPFCAQLEPTLKQVEVAYGDKVRIVWKHKPLSFHVNALPAAEAAEAAREQGKFWPMHDKLFAGQKELSPAAYERWAGEIGLDLARFKASIQSGKARARIMEDDKLASGLGVEGTPAMFANGEEIPGGAVPFERVKAVIDRQLTAKR